MNSQISLNQKLTNQFLKFGHKIAPEYIHKKIIQNGFKLKSYRTSNEELEFIFSANKKIHYLPITNESINSYHWGEGPEIVFAHGWESRGVQFAKFISPLVEKGYSVVAFDAPGHGDSEKKYSHIMEFIEALSLVTKECKNLKAIVSHSMGCTSAVKVLIDSFNNNDIKLIWIAGHLNLNSYLENWAKKKSFPNEILKGVLSTIENKYNMNFNDVQTDFLMGKIKAKTLLIHDKEDNRSPYRAAEMMKATIPESSLHTTTGLGHFKILKAKEIVDVVSDFL